ncbi:MULTISPECIES: hypothetical protein [unclassified Nocardioides]|uniref:hypothetical protein n=1 Tax=unclassified Nocardioides TaxID=2615069 RepID=UPI00105604D1|nr:MULTISPECIES: hypothetical protein [unclassified Nocardioides]
MWVRGVLLLCAVLFALAGCGTASEPSPASGVDELVIPTPSPDPADFVAGVDNPWFPLVPGSTRTYDVSDAHGHHTRTVTVVPGPEIAGVATTAQVSHESGAVVTDWFAQDRDGNVWWFGRAGEWRAGDDGAEAGLAMLAAPRVGDGYRQAYEPGVVEDNATVVALDASTTVPAGTYDDVLLTEQRSALAAGASRDLSYARGVGLVEEEPVGDGSGTVRLVGVAY